MSFGFVNSVLTTPEGKFLHWYINCGRCHIIGKICNAILGFVDLTGITAQKNPLQLSRHSGPALRNAPILTRLYVLCPSSPSLPRPPLCRWVRSSFSFHPSLFHSFALAPLPCIIKFQVEVHPPFYISLPSLLYTSGPPWPFPGGRCQASSG